MFNYINFSNELLTSVRYDIPAIFIAKRLTEIDLSSYPSTLNLFHHKPRLWKYVMDIIVQDIKSRTAINNGITKEHVAKAEDVEKCEKRKKHLYRLHMPSLSRQLQRDIRL